jgi:hypothetical protein
MLGFYVATKSITIQINLYTTPWFATANPETRYLINEIVLAETDTTIDGHHQSHYEMYIEAMESCGANTAGINSFYQTCIRCKHFVLSKQVIYIPNIKHS